MKRMVLTILNGIYGIIDYLSRYKDGKTDLLKGTKLSNGVSKNQKKEIESFWSPYLNTVSRKFAFDYRWFDIYNKTNVFNFDLKYYIPDSFLYCIVDRFFSDTKQCSVIDDKNLYDLYFSDVKMPLTLARRIDGSFADNQYNLISIDCVCDACKNSVDGFIVKPAVNAAAGTGIEVFRTMPDIEILKQKLQSYDNLVVQKLVKQHDLLAKLNDSCVNTIRLVSLIWNEEVKVITSVLIVGGKGSKTNHLHGGGMVCGILPNGQLRNKAFDGYLNCYERHPNGVRFSDVMIPNYQQCVDIVKTIAPRLSGVSKMSSWDFTIDVEGNPVLIETNLTWSGSVQIAGGPVFGDMTKEVLDCIVGVKR